MSAIVAGAVAALKKIVLRVASEKFFEWVFFWAVEMLAESTKTKKDDTFVAKAKELYFEEKSDGEK
jgi:hypothetical protein